MPRVPRCSVQGRAWLPAGARGPAGRPWRHSSGQASAHPCPGLHVCLQLSNPPRATLVGPQPGGASQAACWSARHPTRPPLPPLHRPGAQQKPLGPARFPGPSCLILPWGKATLASCEEMGSPGSWNRSALGAHPRARVQGSLLQRTRCSGRPRGQSPQPRAPRRGPPCGWLSAPALVQKTHSSFSLPQACQTDGRPDRRPARQTASRRAGAGAGEGRALWDRRAGGARLP